MSHPQLVEQTDRLEIHSPMRIGMRVLLAALALFPLIAPYELLIRPKWEHYANPFFAFAALIAVGAMSLSAFLLFAALAGLSSRMVFDRSTRTVNHCAQAALGRPTQHVVPWSNLEPVEVGVREWSDGAPSYYLSVSVRGGPRFESGSSGSREEIERMRARVEAFLAAGDGRPAPPR
jgi:hypothetical protein